MIGNEEEPPVLFERVGDHVAVITLNRPRVHNAINAEMADAITDHVAMVESDPAIRVAIIAARGKSFCSGSDLKQVSAGLGQPLKVRPGGFAGFVYAAREKPWIAAVHANAYGGGVEIALACDMIIAAEDIAFTLPEVKRGLIPGAGGVIRAARFLPRAIALELVGSAAPLAARRAHELGMVNHLAPADRVLDEAIALAGRIAANAPLAVRHAMRVTRAAADVDEMALRAIQEESVEIVRASPDAAEGARAFVEKREPSWGGSDEL
jgi:enoyl-CoA hydratase/carnithine racemase